MTEDETLATFTISFLVISGIGCCVGVWYKLRRQDE